MLTKTKNINVKLPLSRLLPATPQKGVRATRASAEPKILVLLTASQACIHRIQSLNKSLVSIPYMKLLNYTINVECL